jgi:hypothetical protein
MGGGEVQADLMGRTATAGGPSLSSDAVGLAVGIRYEMKQPSKDATAVTVVHGANFGLGHVGVTVTTAISSDGSSETTSIGLEAGVGVARLPGAPTVTVTPQATQGCAGERCAPNGSSP